MVRRWPNARFVRDDEGTAVYVAQAFDPQVWQSGRPLRVVMIGSDFEIRVWETLLRIPMGRATTYSSIARHIGKPKAARGGGRGRGPQSDFFRRTVSSCAGSERRVTGYHWGLTRKQAIIGWESARAGGNVKT